MNPHPFKLIEQMKRKTGQVSSAVRSSFKHSNAVHFLSAQKEMANVKYGQQVFSTTS